MCSWIYAPGQRHRQFLQYLPRGRRKRGKRQGRKVRSERIKWRTSIHHHPAEIEDRGQFGHWEADNVLGAHGTGGLHVSVERSSLYLVGVKIPAITAQATLEAQQALGPKKWGHPISDAVQSEKSLTTMSVSRDASKVPLRHSRGTD